MARRFQAVVFDFDYTLVDSSRGVIECINFALGELGLPLASADAAKRTIGLSLRDTFLELMGPQYVAQSDAFARLFVQRADEAMADWTVLYEQVPETIAAFKAQGISLGIVSTKFRYRIDQILEREGLRGAFDVIVGGEDVAEHKPDPVGLLTAIERLGSVPGSTLYVGDSVTDAETAKRANVPFAAVLSGVTPREAFLDYPVCWVLEDLFELVAKEECQCERKPSSML